MPTRRERLLVERFRALPESARETLLEFLEFLHHRHAGRTVEDAPGYVPVERPESESVVAAMQRLRKTYPMLDMDDLLHRASDLMSAHVVGGRPAGEVIDDLETLFRRAYDERVYRGANR